MRSLEDVLGTAGMLALKDWLNEKYPDAGAPRAPTIYDNIPYHPKHGDKYAVEMYQVQKREWYRIVIRACGTVVIWYPNERSRKYKAGLKQDFFVSYEEAYAAIDRLD